MKECEACHRPATHTFKSGNVTMRLCASCLDQYEIQNLLNARLMEIIDLTRLGDYDKALAILKDLLDANSNRDHTGSFKAAVAAHQAEILAEQGHLDAAIEKARSITVFRNESDFMVNQLFIGQSLERTGKAAEAAEELERGLDRATGPGMPTALSLLKAYARIAETLGLTVPSKYSRSFKDSVDWWGIDVKSQLLNEPESLDKEITAAAQEQARASARYDDLRRELADVESAKSQKSSAREVLRRYIDSEPVGYYRKAAEKQLEELG